MLSLRGTGTPAAAAESGSPRHGHSCLCLLSTSTDSRDGPRPRRSWRGGQRSFTRSHTGLWTPPPGMFMDHLKCHRCLTDLVENGVSYQAGIAHDPVYSTS